MAVSKAQQASVNKYVKANYDRINVTLPKGEKEVIQGCAAATGESVNSFIVRAVRERMERDSGTAPEIAGKPAETAQGAEVVSLPSETIKAAQEAADFAIETVPEFISRAVTAQAQRDHGPSSMISLPKDVVKDAFCGGFAVGESARAFIIRAIRELVEKEKPTWDEEVYQIKALEELALEGEIFCLPFGALDLIDMGKVPEGGKRPEKLQKTADTLKNRFLKG